jgi:predicted transcriptional regulator
LLGGLAMGLWRDSQGVRVMESRVRDVMTQDVVSVRETAEYKDIVAVMRELRVSAFPVLDPPTTSLGSCPKRTCC